MRALRLPVRVLLPIGLIALVIVLGALQYRWLGQVSQAERAQLQRSLNQRVQDFAADFDHQIGMAYGMLGLTNTEVEAGLWSALDTRYDSWKTRASHSELVKAVYFSRAGVDGRPRSLEQLQIGTATGQALEWPDHLAPVLRVFDVVPTRASNTLHAVQVISLGRTSLVESVPALVIAVSAVSAVSAVTQTPQRLSTGHDVMVSLQMASSEVVIVELDGAAITRRILPELVERHFPEAEARYQIAIGKVGAKTLYARGVSESNALSMFNADAMAGFFSTPHLEPPVKSASGVPFRTWQFNAGTLARSRETFTEFRRAPVAPAPGSVSIMLRSSSAANLVEPSLITALGGWHIAVRHGDGSIDAAVERARQRNLAISFSILSVLAFGVGLIVVNARRSEKLAAQQMDFVATVSHELRTPLAVIRSAAQNLSAGVVSDPISAKRYGELIESEGRRLTDMVEEVLEFAGLSGQRRALALRAVDVSSLVRDVMASSAAVVASAQAQADVTIEPDVPQVLGDEEALRRAVSNLLTNALKHGADGRWVGVDVKRHTVEGRDEVHIAVSDRGRGIDTADLPQIFEPFYRGRWATEQQVQGNGLGLSLVSRIAESHGGRVAVASVLGEGATFTIQLPVPADLAAA